MRSLVSRRPVPDGAPLRSLMMNGRNLLRSPVECPPTSRQERCVAARAGSNDTRCCESVRQSQQLVVAGNYSPSSTRSVNPYYDGCQGPRYFGRCERRQARTDMKEGVLTSVWSSTSDCTQHVPFPSSSSGCGRPGKCFAEEGGCPLSAYPCGFRWVWLARSFHPDLTSPALVSMWERSDMLSGIKIRRNRHRQRCQSQRQIMLA